MATTRGGRLGVDRLLGRTWSPGTVGSGPAVRRSAPWPDALTPAVWLVVGLAVAFTYRHAADFSLVTSAGLPQPLFAPQAIILAVLLVTPPRHWWLYLATHYGLLVAEGMTWSPSPLWYLVASNLANVAEPLIGAVLIRRFLPLPLRFASVKEVAIYVACVAAASAVGACWGATMRAMADRPFWLSLRGWFLGDVLASLVLTPTILLFRPRSLRASLGPLRRRRGELVLLGLSLLAVESLLFTTDLEGPETAPALLYLPVPWLVWAAVRFGPHGLMFALSMTTILGIAGVVHGLGPFVEQSRVASVLILQLFLLGVGVPLFCLAGLVQERQEALARLEQSEARYRLVVRNLPGTAVLLFDSDLRHRFSDGQALGRLGIDRATVEGKTPAEAFPADVATLLEPRYRDALAGADLAFDFAFAGRTYLARALPIDHAGAPSGMVVLQEVTEQRRAEELVALEGARTAFFGNVSHELRTPLTLLLAPIQALLAAPPERLDAEVREALEGAHRNAVRLLKLVNSLLDLSRLEAGRLQATFVPTDLASYTAELAGVFRSAIEHAGLRLVVDCPALPEPVYVDRERWEQIVSNLLSNALKFTFEGKIAVSVRLDGERAVLTVRDTGIGIAADELPRLFDRFHRVRGARARTSEGAGIGLALVQHLAHLHGGTVGVESTPGEGSTFTVAIPRGAAHLPADQVEAKADHDEAARPTAALDDRADARAEIPRLGAAAAAHGGGERPPPEPRQPPEPRHADGCGAGPADGTGPPVRLLVVDDNAELRALLRRLLSPLGAVEAVGDGATALRLARSWQPDLILADVMMPELDGFSLLRAVRADPLLRTVPVVLISARAGEEARAEGLRASADDYLVKPFAVPELLARVHGQLRLARLRGEAATAAERQRLARDLHDSVAQSLYSLVLLAEASRRSSTRGQHEQLDECLGQMRATAQQALREMRLIVRQLRPVLLVEQGLVGALGERLEAVERRAGIAARLVVTGHVKLTPAAEEAFYYIAQEALNNALKHAAASRVIVGLSASAEATMLTVADDGRGIDRPEGIGRGGLGIAGMRERAERIGASLSIRGRARGGTQVTVFLRSERREATVARPFEREAREDAEWPSRSAS